jgi:hypothetical protein
MSRDRAENYKGAMRTPKERAAKERGYFEDANNPAAFYTTRKQNDADVKFCWKYLMRRQGDRMRLVTSASGRLCCKSRFASLNTNFPGRTRGDPRSA